MRWMMDAETTRQGIVPDTATATATTTTTTTTKTTAATPLSVTGKFMRSSFESRLQD